MTRIGGLPLYDATASVASASVMRHYSSSFRLASSLFPRRCREAIESIYALVRIADEIVDGTAADAGLDLQAQAERLDELEAETERAIETGFSSNLVVHAFANVARTSGVPPEPIAEFFASMRRDLDDVDFDDAEYRTYIHGSAETVGLMCLRVFVHESGVSHDELGLLEHGAERLGAAFQKVNFLRDLGDDSRRLDRAYLPGANRGGLTDSTKQAIVADIREDLDAARAAIHALPRDCRRAVWVATGLFGELLRRIERLPAHRLAEVRVSVPATRKLMITLRYMLLPVRA